MDLKDFKIPLLSQFSGVGSVVSPISEEVVEITMQDASKKIENMFSERLAQSVGFPDEIIQLRVTNDDKHFVFINEYDIVTFDIKTKERNSKKTLFPPRFLALFNQDKYAVVGRNGEMKMLIYDLDNLSLVHVLDTHKSKINKLYVIPDKSGLLTLMDDEVLRWDLNNLGRLKSFVQETFERA